MHNIIFIGTVHIEKGKCNSDELYKIIKSINPDVIFDEIPSSFFNAFYLTKTQSTVESKAINRYLKKHDVEIIPIDLDTSQEISKYQNEFDSIFFSFFKHEDYIKLDNEKDELMIHEGFKYLNSDAFIDYLNKKIEIEKRILESEPDNERLHNSYKLFQIEAKDKRENAMLQNIYNYSKENQYNKAVFLLGSEHRRSIIPKIEEYKKMSTIRLNWTMYGEN